MIAAAKTPLQVLVEARALLAVPQRWTQDAFARTADGKALYTDTLPGAVRFDALGALEKVTGGLVDKVEPARLVLESLTVEKYLPGFNDSHSHAEVIALFDRGIASFRAAA